MNFLILFSNLKVGSCLPNNIKLISLFKTLIVNFVASELP